MRMTLILGCLATAGVLSGCDLEQDTPARFSHAASKRVSSPPSATSSLERYAPKAPRASDPAGSTMGARLLASTSASTLGRMGVAALVSIAERDWTGAAREPCRGTTNLDALGPRVASAEAACTDGTSSCLNGRCWACCHGMWYDINTCQYGVHFFCNGVDYNAISCWPIGLEPTE